MFNLPTQVEQWRGDTRDYVYRLASINSEGTYLEGTTRHKHPVNPSFAFTLVSALPPNDYDFAIRPYFNFMFADENYGIYLTDNKAHLWERQSDNTIRKVMKLDSISYKTCFGEVDEAEIVVRCQNGCILISMDAGQNYQVYRKRDRTPIYIEPGAFSIQTQGAQVMWAIHGLTGVNSYWNSPKRSTGFPRTTPVPTFQYRGEAPGLSTLTFEDLSVPPNSIAQYQAQFLMGTDAQPYPFAFRQFPTLEATLFTYPYVAGVVGNDSSEEWQGYIYNVSYNKPQELSGGSCTIRARFPDASFLQGMRFRKVVVDIATIFGEDTDTQTVFTGYVSKVSIKQHFDFIDTSIELVNAAGLFSRLTWTPFDTRPFDGYSPNGAADLVLASEAWGTDKREWHPLGNYGIIEIGDVQNPTLMSKTGETKFSTLQNIFSSFKLEIAATDDGLLKTVPRNWVSGTQHIVKAKPYLADRRFNMKEFDIVLDYTASATMVSVTGKDIDENDIYAYLIDVPAETSLLSGRYQHHRSIFHDDVSGPSTVAKLMGRAQDIAQDTMFLKKEATIPLELNVLVGRRDELEVHGVGTSDIPDGTIMEVVAVSGTVGIDPDNGTRIAESVVQVKKKIAT
jgi:hypothetical protein